MEVKGHKVKNTQRIWQSWPLTSSFSRDFSLSYCVLFTYYVHFAQISWIIGRILICCKYHQSDCFDCCEFLGPLFVWTLLHFTSWRLWHTTWCVCILEPSPTFVITNRLSSLLSLQGYITGSRKLTVTQITEDVTSVFQLDEGRCSRLVKAVPQHTSCIFIMCSSYLI